MPEEETAFAAETAENAERRNNSDNDIGRARSQQRPRRTTRNGLSADFADSRRF
jgi:hypothetical protein